jgi:hypothetical protein
MNTFKMYDTVTYINIDLSLQKLKFKIQLKLFIIHTIMNILKNKTNF